MDGKCSEKIRANREKMRLNIKNINMKYSSPSYGAFLKPEPDT